MTESVRVLLFARFRDLLGSDAIEVGLTGATTVEDIRREIAVMNPNAASLLSKSQVSVNGELAGDEVVVDRGDEVALLPPVSGG